MPLTLDSTIGGSAANVYASLVQTDDYALSAFGSEAAAWALLESSNPDLKLPFKIRATRILNALCTFPGDRATITQRLEWPRLGVRRPGGGSFNDGYTTSGEYGLLEIPNEIIIADSMLAVWLASRDPNGDDTFGLNSTASIEQLTVGPIGIKYRAQVQNEGNNYFDEAIVPLLLSGNCLRQSNRLTR